FYGSFHPRSLNDNLSLGTRTILRQEEIMQAQTLLAVTIYAPQSFLGAVKVVKPIRQGTLMNWRR
ncbi:hypothetical protein V3412_29525, partial [Pseudomonas aeruginosa]|uniref:hypothetical protein n=1 Tax=Pseudomonas aeruginosa TaxID=287 RepID=UPI002F919512